eukprot:8929488-Pyramimonas_sp.AAC.1
MSALGARATIGIARATAAVPVPGLHAFATISACPLAAGARSHVPLLGTVMRLQSPSCRLKSDQDPGPGPSSTLPPVGGRFLYSDVKTRVCGLKQGLRPSRDTPGSPSSRQLC